MHPDFSSVLSSPDPSGFFESTAFYHIALFIVHTALSENPLTGRSL
jgi:hypothetical protein